MTIPNSTVIRSNVTYEGGHFRRAEKSPWDVLTKHRDLFSTLILGHDFDFRITK